MSCIHKATRPLRDPYQRKKAENIVLHIVYSSIGQITPLHSAAIRHLSVLVVFCGGNGHGQVVHLPATLLTPHAGHANRAGRASRTSYSVQFSVWAHSVVQAPATNKQQHSLGRSELRPERIGYEGTTEWYVNWPVIKKSPGAI